MSVFADQLLLRFTNEASVLDFLETRIGLPPLFEAGYELTDLDLRELSLAAVLRKECAAPTIETIRASGTQERITPPSERVQVERAWKRFGRLVFVDVRLDLLLATKVQDLRMPIESIRTRELLDELGGAADLNALRTKLRARYTDSIVDALFQRLRITTLEEFKGRLNVFVQFLFKQPAPFNPADPKSARSFPLSVCLLLQSELKLQEALQAAKLCRSVLEREAEYVPAQDGAQVRRPFVFVTVFPDSVAVNDAIPGSTAAQIKTGVQALFAAEGLLAHFFAGL